MFLQQLSHRSKGEGQVRAGAIRGFKPLLPFCPNLKGLFSFLSLVFSSKGGHIKQRHREKEGEERGWHTERKSQEESCGIASYFSLTSWKAALLE